MCDGCVMGKVAARLGRRGVLAAIAAVAAAPAMAERASGFRRVVDMTHTLREDFPTFEGTPAFARSQIAALAREPGLIIGAGTVPDAEAAAACLAAGAQFLVTPWLDPAVVGVARAAGACAMPGALTPTEIRACLSAGADAVKIFPASAVGGPAYVKAMRAVFNAAIFCPTGGVDAGNAPDYFAAGADCVGIGGRLVDEARIAAGDKPAIQAAARAALGLLEA